MGIYPYKYVFDGRHIGGYSPAAKHLMAAGKVDPINTKEAFNVYPAGNRQDRSIHRGDLVFIVSDEPGMNGGKGCEDPFLENNVTDISPRDRVRSTFNGMSVWQAYRVKYAGVAQTPIVMTEQFPNDNPTGTILTVAIGGVSFKFPNNSPDDTFETGDFVGARPPRITKSGSAALYYGAERPQTAYRPEFYRIRVGTMTQDMEDLLCRLRPWVVMDHPMPSNASDAGSTVFHKNMSKSPFDLHSPNGRNPKYHAHDDAAYLRIFSTHVNGLVQSVTNHTTVPESTN